MSELSQLLDCLQNIEDALTSDEYEQGSVITLGGVTDNYIARSPYNTECEWAVLGAVVEGGSATGIIYVSGANPGISTLTTTSPTSLGSQTNGQESNGFSGYILPVSTAQLPTFPLHWQPLGRGANIYINVQMSSGNGYVMLVFRRKLARFLPDMPRPKPVGVHGRLGVHAIRTQVAQSKMVAGYTAQYAGGAEGPYQHHELDAQDTTHLAHAQLEVGSGLSAYQGTGNTKGGYRSYRKHRNGG